MMKQSRQLENLFPEINVAAAGMTWSRGLTSTKKETKKLLYLSDIKKKNVQKTRVHVASVASISFQQVWTVQVKA